MVGVYSTHQRINTYKIVGNSEGKRSLGNSGTDGERGAILQWVVNKCVVRMWTEFILLRAESSDHTIPLIWL
jgi:hypothetical protein